MALGWGGTWTMAGGARRGEGTREAEKMTCDKRDAETLAASCRGVVGTMAGGSTDSGGCVELSGDDGEREERSENDGWRGEASMGDDGREAGSIGDSG
jgi:hypothetical protein